MERVEQIVEGVGEDGGGDAGEGGALRFKPRVADFAGDGFVFFPRIAYPVQQERGFSGCPEPRCEKACKSAGRFSL